MAAQPDTKINLNRLWFSRSQGGKENVTLGIFGRRAAFTVFSNAKDGELANRPLLRLEVPLDRALFMGDTLSKVMKSQDPIRIPVVTTTFNFTAKKRVPGPSIIFFKDDKRRLGFDLVSDGTSFKFIFDANRDTSDGQENLTDEVRSVYGARVFLEVVLKQQLPIAYLLSFMNPAPVFQGTTSRSSSAGTSGYDSMDDSTAVWES